MVVAKEQLNCAITKTAAKKLVFFYFFEDAKKILLSVALHRDGNNSTALKSEVFLPGFPDYKLRLSLLHSYLSRKLEM